ncbi:3-carboxymuconate cyclase [Actinoplanes sp. SE50]|uniref:lactonase family protein n=1 Tax=unclassified Actinoplanes TaxID=2626549 RepID=UPI00023ECFD6|nr:MULTISPECIES: lactonase family protein [unclassified Actinoplanes]AEV82150.1 3-carboxymuconate cyclase [Actinoplanes sp. SE50/110]ATO80549.1 3-carboxymuconate cyclase [Actinoplanes sp. SE50]SLL97955.1 3-carboxymuconate cyclase [Actinoplanes sp. SE50/110]
MGANAEYVFVGCYTGDKGGEGDGITLLRRDPAGGELTRLGLAARTPSPSFLTRHPTLPVLYAVNELDEGTVSAFSVAPDCSLIPLAVRATGGADPCHLAVTADGRHLVVANYTSGSVAVHPLDADGVPGERSDLLTLSGSGPDAERQASPHAHMVVPAPAGPDVLISDLGSDTVWRSRLDPVSGRLGAPEPAVEAKPGTGPRHLTRSADGALLLAGELAGTLSWYRAAGGPVWELRGTAAASAVTGGVFPSEVIAGRDGRFVYLANRGPDTVTTFAWDGESAAVVAETSTGGVWPRHMIVIGDHLYVANERSHTVTVFRIDSDSGIPVPQGEPTGEPSPTCLLRWSPPMIRP